MYNVLRLYKDIDYWLAEAGRSAVVGSMCNDVIKTQSGRHAGLLSNTSDSTLLASLYKHYGRTGKSYIQMALHYSNYM